MDEIWRTARRLLFFALTTLLFFISLPSLAIDSVVNEAKLKAAFIYQFSKFVEWPHEKSGSNPGTNFMICLTQTSPVGSFLEIIAGSKTVRGLTIIVKTLKMGEAAGSCQILYYPGEDIDDISNLLGKVKDMAVLTIGDGADFTKRGGMISFFVEDQGLKFLINREAAKKGGLEVSSQLLKIARLSPE